MTKLPYKWMKYLLNAPETGQGYQIVNIILDDGTIVPNQIVLNCACITGEQDFPVESINSIEVLEKKVKKC